MTDEAGEPRPHAYVIQVSTDNAKTWHPHDDDPQGAVDDVSDANRVATGLLDLAYRTRLDSGAEPLGILRVFMWSGTEAQGAPVATAGTGVDATWEAYERLLSAVSERMKRAERNKGEAQERILSEQSIITASRLHLERAARAASIFGMPQVRIANSARRSREWARQLAEKWGDNAQE